MQETIHHGEHEVHEELKICEIFFFVTFVCFMAKGFDYIYCRRQHLLQQCAA